MPYKDPAEQKRYQREWRARRRDEYMQDRECARCGSGQDLQLDHFDPRIKLSHNIWSWSEKRRQEELAKCQVLCMWCHRVKTLATRRKTRHGKLWMYMGHKCRCDLCVACKRAADKKYRDAAKAREIARVVEGA